MTPARTGCPFESGFVALGSTPQGQGLKREMLAKAGLDTTRVTFVPSDLMTDSWFARLVDAGFEPDKPSFFLWKAVTMYLEREAVRHVLRTIAGTACGSVVAFDYLTTDTLESRSLCMRYARAALHAIGEPWRFGLESTPPVRKQVAALLESCGLSMDEHRTFGQETDRKHARGGFAVAVVLPEG